MKTKVRHLTTYGDLTLVLIEVRPETTLSFRPGEPEIKNGGLVITE
jgi:hypothetical protein